MMQFWLSLYDVVVEAMREGRNKGSSYKLHMKCDCRSSWKILLLRCICTYTSACRLETALLYSAHCTVALHSHFMLVKIL